MDLNCKPPTGAIQAEAQLSEVRLSSFGLRREPPRPMDDRLPGYEALFDYDTLFYDVFRAADRRQVVCLGPPLLNCEEAPSRLVIRVPETGEPVEWRYLAPRSHLQPSCRFLLTGSAIAAAERVALEIDGMRAEVPIRPSGAAHFAGRRVIVTLSKDNPLPWIRDWAEFNVRIHGADGILFYDNGSTTYDLAELRHTLADLPGVAKALVIPWGFPYGPGVGPRNVQDSFYCQPGALEHARRRYCAGARGVLNTDIDELVLAPSQGSIFDWAEASGGAVVTFPGLWANRLGEAPGDRLIRHSDCLYSERRPRILRWFMNYRRFLRMKWVVLPGRCPEDVDWGVHDVYPAGRQAHLLQRSWNRRTRRVLYRHFWPISTGWKPGRLKKTRYASIAFGYDRELARALARAFPERRRDQ